MESIRLVFFHQSSVPSFLGISSSKRPVPDPTLGVEVDRCIIGDVRGAVQVVKIGLQEF